MHAHLTTKALLCKSILCGFIRSVYIYKHAYIHLHTHTRTHTYAHTRLDFFFSDHAFLLWIDPEVPMYVCVYTNMHTHTNIHTYKHASIGQNTPRSSLCRLTSYKGCQRKCRYRTSSKSEHSVLELNYVTA